MKKLGNYFSGEEAVEMLNEKAESNDCVGINIDYSLIKEFGDFIGNILMDDSLAKVENFNGLVITNITYSTVVSALDWVKGYSVSDLEYYPDDDFIVVA